MTSKEKFIVGLMAFCLLVVAALIVASVLEGCTSVKDTHAPDVLVYVEPESKGVLITETRELFCDRIVKKKWPLNFTVARAVCIGTLEEAGLEMKK